MHLEFKMVVFFSDNAKRLPFEGKCEDLDGFRDLLFSLDGVDQKVYVPHVFSSEWSRFLLLNLFSQLSPDTKELKLIRRPSNLCLPSNENFEAQSSGSPRPHVFQNPWAEFEYTPTILETRNTVRNMFGERCAVTHSSKYNVTHIIPEHGKKTPEVLADLEWDTDDLNSPCNLILLCEHLEMNFRLLLWTFIPQSPDPVQLRQELWFLYTAKEMVRDALRPTKRGYSYAGVTVLLPACVSRSALHYHAKVTHQQLPDLIMPPLSTWDVNPNTPPPLANVVRYIQDWLQEVGPPDEGSTL